MTTHDPQGAAKLPAQCPQCSRKGAPIEASRAATIVVRRTCRKCRTRWQIVVKPVRAVRDGFAHRLDWVAL